MGRFNPFNEVEVIAQIADLKEVDYKNTLVITALVELLVEKGVLSRQEILSKAQQLEVDLTLDLLTPDRLN
ncbi:hypothetical protein [Ammoniphilus sp. YIM 78166]|uniref:hypothetical protein n=1 Tax=Ammoniphilus sp. YIM 78166 TaxID=1644106 RepID=UPI00106FA417|nr:hypothetical protein [Ammoniphilus sp. YIM 78166]